MKAGPQVATDCPLAEEAYPGAIVCGPGRDWADENEAAKIQGFVRQAAAGGRADRAGLAEPRRVVSGKAEAQDGRSSAISLSGRCEVQAEGREFSFALAGKRAALTSAMSTCMH